MRVKRLHILLKYPEFIRFHYFTFNLCENGLYDLLFPNLFHLLLTVSVYAATLNEHNVQTVQTLSPENQLKQFDNLLIDLQFCLEKPAKNSNSKWYGCDKNAPENRLEFYLKKEYSDVYF